MSKFLKRIGTSAKRFRFELKVCDAEFEGSMDGKLQVLWARGPKIAATNFVAAKHDGNGERAVVIWDESLTMIATLYENSRSKKHPFQKKPSRLYLKQKLDGSKQSKTIGRIDLDLGSYVTREASIEDTVEDTFDIGRCNDKDPRLNVVLSYKYVHDMDVDAMSVDSASMDIGGYWEPSVSTTNRLSSPSFNYPKSSPHSPVPKRSNKSPDLPPLGIGRAATSSSSSPGAGNSSKRDTGNLDSVGSVGSSSSNGNEIPIKASSRRPSANSPALTMMADESLRISEEDARPITPRAKKGKSLTGKARDVEIEYEKKIQLLNERLKKTMTHFEQTAQRFTTMEVDYVRVKVDLVDTVNSKNDLEMELMQLKDENKQLKDQLAAEQEKVRAYEAKRRGGMGAFFSRSPVPKAAASPQTAGAH